MIAVRIREKAFAGQPVLRNVGFHLGAGDRLALLGPSGVGKSTLMRIVAGLDRDFTGEVNRPAGLAMAFQEPTLLPWRDALSNLVLAHPEVSLAAARDMLARVGLAEKATAFPGQLSLGQQRRLSLARACLGAPQALLLDEPFVSLDAATAADMLELTSGLIAELKPALLLVTHDPSEADRLGARRLILGGQPATVTGGPS